MDEQLDLQTAGRDVVIDMIIRQPAIIERLEKRIVQLEGRSNPVPPARGGARGSSSSANRSANSLAVSSPLLESAPSLPDCPFVHMR